MSAPLPESLATLLEPGAYPHFVDRIELLTTHISWVLLAGDYAYKIKRPVRYPFIDLTSLERRRLLCEEELRLNRRFAPELYIEVCKVVGAGGGARMRSQESAPAGDSPEGQTILEYAVRMHRFSREEELDQLLDRHRIEPPALEAFGHELAQIHARAPAAAATSPWGRPEAIHSELIRNLLECADAAALFGSAGEVLELRSALQARSEICMPWMGARRGQGRIRECHGDLHSRNIVRIQGRLRAFDCLEYEPAWRWIDTADEIAFLTSDLTARARPLHAQAFRGGYLAESGDYQACRLLSLYEAHRALVRAKVAALEAAQRPDAASQDGLRRGHLRLLAFAARALTPKRPRLLLMSGLSGSGKTWLARQLAERLSAVHVRSDVERKRRAGLRELTPSHSRLGEDLYSPQATATLYADLERAAEEVLSGGISVIVDATFLERAQRARFVGLAARCGMRLQLIWCEAPEPLLRARITERMRVKRDASEADLGVLAWQLARAEEPAAEETMDVLRMDALRPDALDLTLRRIGGIPCAPADQL
jgi:aminoglycoside phosphotransferase family enzyme/predicted kinase